MSDQDNLRDAEALGEARRRDRADSGWHAREARLLFIDAARWQRDQLRTDEAIERLANFLFEDDNGESINQHEKICHDASKCRFRSDYTQFARAAIAALLEQEPRP